jgi:serine/threonine-protein kinase
MESTLLGARYRVDGPIASGGMGAVYRGWDTRLARPVALKILHRHLAADAEFERRFRAEARHAARVRHSNVVAVLDTDEHDGVPFIVMELVTGQTLREVLRRRGRLAPHEVARVLEQACAGLSAIHRCGIVHRDVKPENLLIDGTGVVRVADFGIAHAADTSWCTPAGVLLGSVRYIAPEVVLGGRATPASDQYALGVALFEALTGQAPLPEDDAAVLALRHAREAVPAPSTVERSIPPGLDTVVTTATALRPDDRYATLDALNIAFQAAVSDGPSETPSPRADASGTQRRPAPLLPTARNGSAPAAGRRAPHSSPPSPRHPRRSISVLAVAAAILSLFGGISGFVLAPVCGWIALRRIMGRAGRLRGAWLAQMAIGVSALRLIGYLATQGA